MENLQNINEVRQKEFFDKLQLCGSVLASAGFYLLVLLLQHCTINKKSEKIAYEFPSTMPDGVKIAYAKQCEKGIVLYRINCGGCHTQIIKNKEIIPDFPIDALAGYDIRLENEKHSASLTPSEITTEELGYIITFLTYKKKNSIKIKK